ncbi:MAG: transporter [Pseudomonadota bacterium]
MRRIIICAALGGVALAGPATAGGFDRGGVNVDLLFDDRRFVAEATGTYVFPQRTLDDIVRDVNLAGLPPASSASVGVGGDFFVPRIALKAGLGRHVDCVATYGQPFGADASFGLNNAHSASSADFEVDSDDFGLTCSAKFALGSFKFDGFPETKGRFRIIGGVSHLDLKGMQRRQTFADFVGVPDAALPAALSGLNAEGLGAFKLSDKAVGYRIGFAYEIPVPDAKRGFRISAIYSSRYDLNLDGTVDISAFNTPAALASPVSDVSANTEIPQSVEVKAQAPVAALGVLVDASFKWQDWSRLGTIPIAGVVSPVTGAPSPLIAFEPLYEDGLTVEVGVGAELAEGLSGRIAGRWDRGTSTSFGFQTDTWALTGGLRYARENVEATIGGSIGLLTSGSSSGVDTVDPANDLSYSFGNDFVGAVSASLKIAF